MIIIVGVNEWMFPTVWHQASAGVSPQYIVITPPSINPLYFGWYYNDTHSLCCSSAWNSSWKVLIARYKSHLLVLLWNITAKTVTKVKEDPPTVSEPWYMKTKNQTRSKKQISRERKSPTVCRFHARAPFDARYFNIIKVQYLSRLNVLCWYLKGSRPWLHPCEMFGFI